MDEIHKIVAQCNSCKGKGCKTCDHQGGFEVKNEPDMAEPEFYQWITGLGGFERVASLSEVDKSTLHRYCNGSEKLPKLWKNFMKISKELAELKQEKTNLKRKK